LDVINESRASAGTMALNMDKYAAAAEAAFSSWFSIALLMAVGLDARVYLLSMLFAGREETADSTGLESRNRSGDEDTSMGVAATKLVKARCRRRVVVQWGGE
jgi:hypothetical protein